jgi:RNA polymerase sigma factor (sigma-70 family)
MASGRMGGILQQMRRVVGREGEPLPDRELLERFVAHRDEAAFTALVQRHGGMVLGICRRVLHQVHDAEDACQATFLVLARQASAIRKMESLACWLHGVAYRVAANLKRTRTRRGLPEELPGNLPQSDTTEDIAWRDVVAALDGELNRLPERYRAPLVLCYLEGKTRDEAAQELGWSVGTLRGLLERGRDLLRARLTRRGLTLPATLLAVGLSQQAASAALPPALATATVQAVLSAASGPITALAEGVLQTMFLSRIHTVVLAAVAVVALTLGGGLVARGLGKHTAAAGNGEPAPEFVGVPGMAAPAQDDGFGPEVKGLRSQITLAKQRYVVHEVIPVTYLVKNVSKQEQVLHNCGFWPNHQILVTDAAGREPALTELGRQCQNAFRSGERFKDIAVRVPAGDVHASYAEYDLTRFYDLSQPGRYTVQYVYEERGGGWAGRLPSNEVSFVVVEERAPEMVESKAVVANGLSFVVTVPKRVLAPLAGPREVNLGMRVTNVSDKPVTLPVWDVIVPTVFNTVDGRKLTPDYRRKDMPRVVPPVTLAPGKSWTWQPRATLSLSQDRATLQLSGPDGLGVAGAWSISTLKVGKHRLSVQYSNAKPREGETALWVGKVTTEEAEFEIVAADPADPGAVLEASRVVRAENVEFQAVVEPRRPVPAAGGRNDMDLGLRITNRSQGSLLFDLNQLMPILTTADGQGVTQTGERLRAAYATPVELGPGQSATVLWRGALEAQDADTTRLRFIDGTAYHYQYEGLRPGRYRLRFQYEVSDPAANTLAGKYGELPKGMTLWTGKVVTENVTFDLVPPAQAEAKRPLGVLLAELESADGGTRLAATLDLFDRGKDGLTDLEKAGARQIATAGTITPRRMDVIYSLIKGLPPGNYLRNSFGLRLDPLGTEMDVKVMGTQHGFALQGTFNKAGAPNCYVTIEDQGTRMLPEVLKAVLMKEVHVRVVNLNYVER